MLAPSEVKINVYSRYPGGYIRLSDTISHYACDQCNTVYPVINGLISCNGVAIKACPYCKGDSHGKHCRD